MKTNGKMRAVAVVLVAFGTAGGAAADTPSRTDSDAGSGDKTVEPADPGVIDGDHADALDSGGPNWGLYEVSASAPVTSMVRLSAHHARKWDSTPDSPEVKFDISAYANDWDIADMGLEIKADHVPGYYIIVKVCARTAGNVGGDGGAIDSLSITGASTSPEITLASFDPSGTGTCKTVNVYTPLEPGADEYTLMVRPQVQVVQTYWQYTVYGKVTVQYHPIFD
jgi:hypothetical protein